MTAARPFMQPRLALGFLLAACVALGGTGCVTASRATLTPPLATEPVTERPPAPEPARAVDRKAERPKASAKRAPPRSAPEGKLSVAARAPELKRAGGASSSHGETVSGPVPFEPSAMTRPHLLSGREPQLTPEARAERVRGTALVRCVVTREGRVTGCRLLNGLPHMEKELLDTLSTWRVTPITAEGSPLDVDYTFVIRIPTG